MSYNKAQGMLFNGVKVSLNKTNQDGISALDGAQKLLTKKGSTIFPFTFMAETANGKRELPIADLEDFEAFAVQFIMERQSVI